MSYQVFMCLFDGQIWNQSYLPSSVVLPDPEDVFGLIS